MKTIRVHQAEETLLRDGDGVALVVEIRVTPIYLVVIGLQAFGDLSPFVVTLPSFVQLPLYRLAILDESEVLEAAPKGDSCGCDRRWGLGSKTHM